MNRDLKELRVLLVEDSSWTQTSIANTIREAYPAAQVTVVDSEADAVEAISRNSPQLIVLDLLLRQGNGFNVLQSLRTKNPKPVTVVLTNYALPKYRDMAFLMGAGYFLDKSLSLDALPPIVRSVAENIAR